MKPVTYHIRCQLTEDAGSYVRAQVANRIRGLAYFRLSAVNLIHVRVRGLIWDRLVSAL